MGTIIPVLFFTLFLLVVYHISHSKQLPSRSGASWGIASLIIGIVAFLGCWIPILNLLAAPIGAVGLVLGLIAVVIALKRQGVGAGFACAGVAISALSLIVILAINGLIVGGVNAASKAISEAEQRRTQTNQIPVIPTRSTPKAELTITSSNTPATKETPSPTATPTPSIAWTSATLPVKQGDVQIQVLLAGVMEIPLNDEIRERITFSSEPLLGIVVDIKNVSKTKKIDYKTWAGSDFSLERDFAMLLDNYGNNYKRVNFGVSVKPIMRVERDSIYPDKSATDILVFERPIDGIKYMNMELPASNFGGDGMIRLQIPSSMIGRLKWNGKKFESVSSGQ